MRTFTSFFGAHSPIMDELNERARQYAAEKGFEYIWLPQNPYNKTAVIEQLKISDTGLIDVEPYDESIFRYINEKCKLLIRFGVGYDKVNLADATKYGITVARTAGANSTGVAELALTLILAARRQLMINRKIVNSGKWVRVVGNETIGKTVGIVGFGAIGKILARLLQGFNCEILAYDPMEDSSAMRKLGVEKCELEDLVKRSDAISIHAPYNESTHHMFNEKLISMMKPTAVLVCTARGNIIDESALYDALVNHKIGGAGLDVYSVEPFPATSPLVSLENVILTPHIASQTVESIWATYKKAIDLADDFYSGRELKRPDLLN